MTDNEILTAINELKINVSAYRAEATAQSCITNAALAGVNQRLDKINGKVGEHEKTINDRSLVVQQFMDFKESYKEVPEKIRHLEDNQLSQSSIRKWVVTSIGITATVVGIIFTVLNYFMKSGG